MLRKVGIPRRRTKAPVLPMTGETPTFSAPNLPDLVRYESFEGGMRRRWVPGFTRRGPGVPEGWMEEGSPEELAARKEAEMTKVEAAAGHKETPEEKAERERREFAERHRKYLMRQASSMPHILRANARRNGRFR